MPICVLYSPKREMAGSLLGMCPDYKALRCILFILKKFCKAILFALSNSTVLSLADLEPSQISQLDAIWAE